MNEQSMPEVLAEIRANVDAAYEQKRKLTAKIVELECDKKRAYIERNKLVAALSKLFPSHLSTADKPEPGWNWVVIILLPTGQISYHIHDSEQPMFEHLSLVENDWDGHDTETKYARLDALADYRPKLNFAPVTS